MCVMCLKSRAGDVDTTGSLRLATYIPQPSSWVPGQSEILSQNTFLGKDISTEEWNPKLSFYVHTWAHMWTCFIDTGTFINSHTHTEIEIERERAERETSMYVQTHTNNI